MAGFDLSPRAAKKRRITAEGPTPIYSRVLRTVRQAVYGKPSSPKLTDDTSHGEQKRTVKPLQGKPEGKRSPRGRDNAKPAAKLRIGDNTNTDALDDEDEETSNTPSRIDHGSRNKKKVDSENSGEGSVENTEEMQNPSKKRRKNGKGWAYVDDKDKLAQGGPQGEAMDIDIETERVKRGHEDLTIGMNPHQLKPRQSQNRINGARVGKNSDSGRSTTSSARRTSRRNEAKEEDKIDVRPIARFDLPRKIGRLKKLPADVVISPVAEAHEVHELTKPAREDVSPDERSQAPQAEEIVLGQQVQTPTRMPNKKTRRLNFTSLDKELVSVAETLVPATEEDTVLDSPASCNDHAQALQKILGDDPKVLTAFKMHVLSGLTGKRRLPLMNVEDEEMKVKNLVEQTVLAGEGNSMLIIGSRGSGKSSLVESVLSNLSSEHRDDFHVVRLNGFIHTDDKLALREIWRQLGREMDVENDDLGGRSNYADTLTSLLALLAHPAAEEDEAATSRSVVFVLDEFDLFTSHPRQTLLYNLFDVAQSRNAPIAVLGLTTKVNVVDSLEKRVKSRFGQRYVHLSLPKIFSAFQDICLSALNYRPSTHDLLQHNKADLQGLSRTWNDYISTLFATPLFQQFLQTLYTSTKSVPAFLNASLLPISTMSATTLPTAASFISYILQPPDSKLALIPALSTLALSLLIAAARLDIILDTDVCTFGMAYEEYVALASKSKLQSSAAGQVAVGGGARVWSKELAQGAWEHLGKLELVLPAMGGSRGAGKGEMWRVDVGLEEIGGVLESESGRGGPLGRWCREI